MTNQRLLDLIKQENSLFIKLANQSKEAKLSCKKKDKVYYYTKGKQEAYCIASDCLSDIIEWVEQALALEEENQ